MVESFLVNDVFFFRWLVKLYYGIFMVNFFCDYERFVCKKKELIWFWIVSYFCDDRWSVVYFKVVWSYFCNCFCVVVSVYCYEYVYFGFKGWINLLVSVCVVIDICYRDDIIVFFFCFSILCVFVYFRFYILKNILVSINKCIVFLEIDVFYCLFIFYFVFNRGSIIDFNFIRGCNVVVISFICCFYGDKIFFGVI